MSVPDIALAGHLHVPIVFLSSAAIGAGGWAGWGGGTGWSIN